MNASSAPVIYPVTRKQKFILDQVTHPDCPDDLRDRWIVANAFVIKPRIDLRRLSRALDKLSRRHDSLRMRFARLNDSWRAVIHRSAEGLVREIELGEMDDASFEPRIIELANTPMEVDGGPMAEFLVARCGSRGDALIVRIHHTLTDGFGMIILTEDLLKTLIGIPILGKAVQFPEYLSKWQDPPKQRAPQIKAYWQDLHARLPKAPQVGRAAKGLPPLVDMIGEIDSRRVEFRTSDASFAALEAKARARNIAFSTLRTAAHLEALCKVYDLPELAFITYISRTDPALGTYMGDHTLDTVIPYARNTTDDIFDAAAHLAMRYGEVMEHLPSETSGRGTAYFNGLVAAGIFPTQFAIHQARAVVRQKKSIFSDGFFADYGEEQKMGPFTISGINVNTNPRILAEMQLNVGDGKQMSRFSIQYDGLAYAEDEVIKLGGAHCALLGVDLTDVVTS